MVEKFSEKQAKKGNFKCQMELRNRSRMKEFDELVVVVDHLLSENGCPWDRKQTMKTIRSDVLEEVCELIEAIDLEDNNHIEEELGDLFFNVVFLSRLAEKENRTKMEIALTGIKEKLVRRHPHVFGNESIEGSEQLKTRWDQIKLTEKGKEHRTSVLDGIPKGMPALCRAQKVTKKMQSAKFEDLPRISTELKFNSEEELGSYLASIVILAKDQGLDAEHALKNYLIGLETKFRLFEKSDL